MKNILLIIFSLLSLLYLCIGFLLAKKPRLAIELQRRFYAKINWNIEPISMPKELRNTRIMGILLIILSLATVFIILRKKF